MVEASGLEAVFLQNRAILGRYLRVRLRSEVEVEDALQDLWVKASAADAGPIAEPLAYLYRMADNLALDRRRSAARRAHRESEWTKGHGESVAANPVDVRPNAERILVARDHLRRVNAVLDELPERTAYAFRAVRLDGVPQKELATLMGITVSGVEKHLQRAYRAVMEVKKNLDVEVVPGVVGGHEDVS